MTQGPECATFVTMTDKLTGVFLAIRRLRPDQQDEIAERLAAELAQLEGQAYAKSYDWPFANRRALVNAGRQRQPANHPERRARTA